MAGYVITAQHSPSAAEKVAVESGRLSDVFVRESGVSVAQQHVGRQLAAGDRNASREVHPYHTQHTASPSPSPVPASSPHTLPLPLSLPLPLLSSLPHQRRIPVSSAGAPRNPPETLIPSQAHSCSSPPAPPALSPTTTRPPAAAPSAIMILLSLLLVLLIRLRMLLWWWWCGSAMRKLGCHEPSAPKISNAFWEEPSNL